MEKTFKIKYAINLSLKTLDENLIFSRSIEMKNKNEDYKIGSKIKNC